MCWAMKHGVSRCRFCFHLIQRNATNNGLWVFRPCIRLYYVLLFPHDFVRVDCATVLLSCCLTPSGIHLSVTLTHTHTHNSVWLEDTEPQLPVFRYFMKNRNNHLEKHFSFPFFENKSWNNTLSLQESHPAGFVYLCVCVVRLSQALCINASLVMP